MPMPSPILPLLAIPPLSVVVLTPETPGTAGSGTNFDGFVEASTLTASESALGGTAVHLAPADLEDRFGVFELLPFKSLFGMNLADHSSSENVADWKAWVVGLLAWSLLFRSWAGDVFGVSWSL